MLVVAQGRKRATVSVAGCGSIPTRGNEIFIIFISAFAILKITELEGSQKR